MPRQYSFNVRRDGKKPCTYYHICPNDKAAYKWIRALAKEEGWGECGVEWVTDIWSRPLSQVYDHLGDRVGYLNEISEELFVRETSGKPAYDSQFVELSWNDLCEAAIEILESLKGEV